MISPSNEGSSFHFVSRSVPGSRRGETGRLPARRTWSGCGATLSRRTKQGEKLRAENREDAFAGLVEDLRTVARRLESSKEVRKA
jgi:hypothetical protein